MATKDNSSNQENAAAASQPASSLGEVSAQADTNSQVKIETKAEDVLIEGYLKKHKNYLLPQKHYYRVVGNKILKASNPKKPFHEKYDLSNY